MLLRHIVSFVVLIGLRTLAAAPEVTPIVLFDRPHHAVRTGSVTWVYDDAGGGFTRLIDADGHDWIGFQPEPLAEFPAAAAAGYRGLGNLVHSGADGGVGHPGFDRCTTTFEPPATLRTRSRDGKWEFTWSFGDDQVAFTMVRAPTGRRWWFLYEGNPHGRFEPTAHAWGEPGGAPRTERPAISDQLRVPLRAAWFGHRESRFRLHLEHETEAPLTANLWWMGAEARGQWRESRDGMLVFGFGRGSASEGPLLEGSHCFTVRLAPSEVAP